MVVMVMSVHDFKFIVCMSYDPVNINHMFMCFQFLASFTRFTNDITVITNNKFSKVIIENFPLVNLIIGENVPELGFNLGFKLFNLSKLNYPYICFDADQYFFKNPIPLIELAKNIHGWNYIPTTPYGRFSGVHICNDPDFLNWSELESFMHFNKYSESGVIREFLARKKLIVKPIIECKWNAISRYYDVFLDDSKKYRAIAKKKYDLWYGNEIYIGHYPSGSRYWDLNCQIYKREFCKFKEEFCF